MGGQVMSLIENHQIPARGLLQAFDSCRSLQGVDTGDESIMFGESIGFAVSDVALGAKCLEIEVEHVIELSVPVVY